MQIEGVLLTGGASRRMGEDKAWLTVGGEVLSERIARLLSSVCAPVTVLGREPVEGCAFLPDEEEFAGPLVALSRFSPSAPFVFVASCDLPLFDARLVALFGALVGDRDAILPLNDGKVQPLCALYSAQAWTALRETVADGKKSMMAWLDRLDRTTVSQDELARHGIDRRAICGANTPEEWSRLLDQQGLA